MKKLLLSLSLLVPMVSFAGSFNSFPPLAVQKMMEKEAILNDKCRGKGIESACDARDAMLKKIESKGWCWGSREKDAAGYQLDWLKCSEDATKGN